MEKLKVSVIREELVALTGDYKKAIILNQFIYWSDRVNNSDKFILEEKERNQKWDRQGDFSHYQVADGFLSRGWIYKMSEELSEETMLGLSKSNMREHIKFLVENGWLSERSNPAYKWDKTLQYRVDLLKIEHDLNLLGYTLQDYKTEPRGSKTELYNSKTELYNSKTEQQYQRLLPEITTEIKKDNITASTTKYTIEFEQFYSEYPRPQDKHRSFTNWKTQLKSYTVQQLMSACKGYKQKVISEGTDLKYIKTSANFLGKEKPFEDYIFTSSQTQGEVEKERLLAEIDERENKKKGREELKK